MNFIKCNLCARIICNLCAYRTRRAFDPVGSLEAVKQAGGYLSRDGGGLFLREVELRRRIIRKLSHCFDKLTTFRDVSARAAHRD